MPTPLPIRKAERIAGPRYLASLAICLAMVLLIEMTLKASWANEDSVGISAQMANTLI